MGPMEPDEAMPMNQTRTACPYADVCAEKFRALSARIDEQDGRWRSIDSGLSTVREKLAGLEGRIAGYLVAASLLGTVVAFIAAYVLRTPL